MKNKKTNAAQIWKQLEDLLVPRLCLSVIDRAVYSHLLRHTRLEGRARIRFSIAWLARAARLSTNPVRNAVRRLADYGVLRLVARTKSGHVVEVHLPKEVRAARAPAPSAPRCQPGGHRFHENQGSAHGHPLARSRPMLLLSAPPYSWPPDPRPCRPPRSVGAHFLPQPRLVLSRVQFSERRPLRRGFSPLALPPAPLDRAELTDHLRALDDLASGKLRPAIAPIANPRRMGRPPLLPASP